MKKIIINLLIFFIFNCNKFEPHNITVEFIGFTFYTHTLGHKSGPGDIYIFKYKIIETKNPNYQIGQIIEDTHQIKDYNKEEGIKFYNNKIGTIIDIGDNDCDCPLIRYLGLFDFY
jgi:hypothetical protein